MTHTNASALCELPVHKSTDMQDLRVFPGRCRPRSSTQNFNKISLDEMPPTPRATFQKRGGAPALAWSCYRFHWRPWLSQPSFGMRPSDFQGFPGELVTIVGCNGQESVAPPLHRFNGQLNCKCPFARSTICHVQDLGALRYAKRAGKANLPSLGCWPRHYMSRRPKSMPCLIAWQETTPKLHAS